MQDQFTPVEEWRPHPADSRIEVSSTGRIRFYPTLMPDNFGYVQAALNRKLHRLHVLVAETFISARPDGAQVNHKNGQKHDNRVENLEWVSRSKNIEHAYATGLRNTSRGGVTAAIALEVANSSELARDLAERYGVAERTIRDIRRGRTWRHVTGLTAVPIGIRGKPLPPV